MGGSLIQFSMEYWLSSSMSSLLTREESRTMTEWPSMLGWTRTGCRHHLPAHQRVCPPLFFRQLVCHVLLMDRSHFHRFTALKFVRWGTATTWTNQWPVWPVGLRTHWVLCKISWLNDAIIRNNPDYRHWAVDWIGCGRK